MPDWALPSRAVTAGVGYLPYRGKNILVYPGQELVTALLMRMALQKH